MAAGERLQGVFREGDLAMAELGQIGHLFVSLPWLVANFEQAKSSLGDDYWSYGFANNRHVLEVFMRYHHAQGLSKAWCGPSSCSLPRHWT